MKPLSVRLNGPLDKATANAISTSYGNMAHVVVLLCARNTCWKTWHTEPKGLERIRAELGYRVLQHTIMKLIDRTVEKLVYDSHA